MGHFLKLYDWILQDNKLTISDRIVFSKILQLHSAPKGCVLTNEQMADTLNLNFWTIKDALKRLTELEYVKSETTRRQGGVDRKLIPLRTEDMFKEELKIKLKKLNSSPSKN